MIGSRKLIKTRIFSAFHNRRVDKRTDDIMIQSRINVACLVVACSVAKMFARQPAQKNLPTRTNSFLSTCFKGRKNRSSRRRMLKIAQNNQK